MKAIEVRMLRTLTLIESNPRLTQRLLAEKLGVALGTVNNTFQELVDMDLVNLTTAGGKTTYKLTGAGVVERLRLSRLHLEEKVDVYDEIRAQISARIDSLDQSQKQLVFYGAGSIAQIAYVVVASRDLQLVGVVDDEKAGQKFLDYDVVHPAELSAGYLQGNPFDVVILTSHSRSQEMRLSLRKMDFPLSQLLGLFDTQV